MLQLPIKRVMLAAGSAVMIVVHATMIPAAGQVPATAPYRAPRTQDGRPDLNGFWQAVNTANYDVQAHVARPAMAVRPGPYGPLPAGAVVALGAVGAVPPGLGVVDDNDIPYRPEMLARKKENQDKWLERDPEIKCYLPGVPRATYMPFPFQIFQSQSQVFIAYEYAGAVRNIYMKDPGEAPVESWMGQSVGRWDGETFVVEVTGFNDQTWFDRSGNFHSEALKVTERYTRTGPDHMRYEATIDDPKVFTRPWKISMPLYRRVEANMRLLEFKCIEFVQEVLYGATRKKPLPR
jgi:hypothetical protein